MTATLADAIEAVLSPAAKQHGLTLVDVEVAGAHHQPILRVFLDMDGGISLDTVCAANSWVSSELEELPELGEAYTLEVSSPGIERPLRKLSDFQDYVGSTAAIKTAPIDGRSSFTGVIDEAENDTIVVDVDGMKFRIPLKSVRKARLKVDIDLGDERSGGTR